MLDYLRNKFVVPLVALGLGITGVSVQGCNQKENQQLEEKVQLPDNFFHPIARLNLETDEEGIAKVNLYVSEKCPDPRCYQFPLADKIKPIVDDNYKTTFKAEYGGGMDNALIKASNDLRRCPGIEELAVLTTKKITGDREPVRDDITENKMNKVTSLFDYVSVSFYNPNKPFP